MTDKFFSPGCIPVCGKQVVVVLYLRKEVKQSNRVSSGIGTNENGVFCERRRGVGVLPRSPRLQRPLGLVSTIAREKSGVWPSSI